MVRLKEGDVTLDDLRELEFQFHNGSIKRRAGRRGRGWFFQFQFHNGSIKSDRFMKSDIEDAEVSIPQWFD